MFIGVDDTDSRRFGCTTYLAAVLCEKLEIKGFPRLIRLDPNIPYKTRGNGAISIEVEAEDIESVKKVVLRKVEELAQLDDKKTNSGVVFIEKITKKEKRVLKKFYLRAVSELVTIREAEEVAKKVKAEVHKFKLGRGIIGALAAIGAVLPDRTYELLAYKVPENYGREKKLDKESVFEMDKKMYPGVWDNIDYEKKQILITPHGYDPVFSGIRGDAPEAVEKAWRMVKPLEKIERWQIFETNQGTDAHLRKKKISQIKGYDCVILQGKVSKEPVTGEGGHVIFELNDNSGKIECAAYEPTGKFRDVVRKLQVGDKVKVFGGIGKYPNTVNLEKIEILSLEKIFRKEVPVCCGRKMTSAGKNKGYKCRRCGKRVRTVEIKEFPRNLNPGFYEVPPRARRHLAMPLVRMSN